MGSYNNERRSTFNRFQQIRFSHYIRSQLYTRQVLWVLVCLVDQSRKRTTFKLLKQFM